MWLLIFKDGRVFEMNQDKAVRLVETRQETKRLLEVLRETQAGKFQLAAPEATAPEFEVIDPMGSQPNPVERRVIYITRTNQFWGNTSLYELNLALVESGQVIDQLIATSGQPGRQYFRTVTQSKGGSLEPLPEGYWTVGAVEWAGMKGDFSTHWTHPTDGLGPVWIGMECTSPTEREAIGIHLDANAAISPGTAGCVGLPSMSALKTLLTWFDDPRYSPKVAIVDWGWGTVTSPIKSGEPAVNVGTTLDATNGETAADIVTRILTTPTTGAIAIPTPSAPTPIPSPVPSSASVPTPSPAIAPAASSPAPSGSDTNGTGESIQIVGIDKTQLNESQTHAFEVLAYLPVEKFNHLKSLIGLRQLGRLDRSTLTLFLEFAAHKGIDFSLEGVTRFKDLHIPGGNQGGLRGKIGRSTALVYFHQLTKPAGLRFSTSYTRAELLPQLNEIQRQNYTSFIKEAAKDFNVQPSVIAGIGSRESHWGLILNPPGPGGTGDRGHGHGLMQIDSRFHEFARTGDWHDPRANIRYGCNLLADNREALREEGLTGRALLRATLASYNAGLGNVLEILGQGINVDLVTTGRDYSKDVLDRAGWFQTHTNWQ